MFIMVTFCNIRKPKYAVDGANGPASKKTGVPWIRTEEEKAILDSTDKDVSLDNIHFQEVVEYMKSLGKIIEVAKSVESSAVNDSDDGRDRALEARVRYMIGANPTISLSAAQQKKRRERNQPEAPPASVPSIEAMLEVLQAKMDALHVSGQDWDLTTIFQEFMQSDTVERFIATQTNMAENLALQRAGSGMGDFDTSYNASIKEIKEA